MSLTFISTQRSAAVGQESQAGRPLVSVFPEWLVATSVADQSMRFPQIVNRSISRRSFLEVLCFVSEGSCASSSSSSSFKSMDGSCSASASGGGLGGRLAGLAGEG